MAALRRGVGKLAVDTTAFLLCDVQVKFAPTIKYFPQICQVAQRLSVASKTLDIPLVATEHYPKALGPMVPDIDINHATVFPKTQFSMMLPEVMDHLHEVRPKLKSVVLYGIETQMCIQQTALDFVDQDYEVHVIADATSSRTMTERLLAFERMRQCGVFVTTSESMLFMLLRDAKHPKFREIQRLIMESAPSSELTHAG